jgi:penicillin-binding protein 2
MSDHYQKRPEFIIIAMVFFAVLLLVQAARMQLFDNTFKKRGTIAAIDKVVIYPERGLIFDRNDSLLLYNTLTYDLMVTYNKIDPEMDTAKFCEILQIDRSVFVANLNKNWSSGRYSKNIPFVFLKKVNPTVFARFQEHIHEFPGFSAQRRSARVYPHTYAAHLLGYIREADQQLIDESAGFYKPGDYLGASGLEKHYESLLRGIKGVQYQLKDNVGRAAGSYKDGAQDSLPYSGADLISSLDLQLQGYGEELMRNKIGSIVALDPATGEILAMITAPSYDPNLLTIDRSRGEAYSTMLIDPTKPLFDRSLMARYPPGSIFKTVLSLIALQEGFLKPNTAMTCGGAYFVGSYRWGCRAHPYPSDIASALQYSCNTYYYQVFRTMVDRYGARQVARGLDTLATRLHKFGLGVKLGVDLPGENSGYIPTSNLYDKMYGKNRWRSTSIISLGIGQGEIQMNTLQMANLAAIIANRGWYIIPHVIRDVRDSNFVLDKHFTEKQFCGVDQKHFEPVIEGMARAVAFGSASSAYMPDITVCGKTGTSQNPHGEDHSVFIAFAPRDNPKIAIAVYVENSGYGGRFAAPIASLMIEKYLNRFIRENRKYLEDRMLESNLIYIKT